MKHKILNTSSIITLSNFPLAEETLQQVTVTLQQVTVTLQQVTVPILVLPSCCSNFMKIFLHHTYRSL